MNSKDTRIAYNENKELYVRRDRVRDTGIVIRNCMTEHEETIYIDDKHLLDVLRSIYKNDIYDGDELVAEKEKHLKEIVSKIEETIKEVIEEQHNNVLQESFINAIIEAVKDRTYAEFLSSN